jgi:rubredoxin
MTLTLENLDARLSALEGKAITPAPSGNPDLDPRWYTPMTDAEKKAFTAANPNLTANDGGGEVALQRARFGWTDKQSSVGPETLAAGFAKNVNISKMTQSEYMASEYRNFPPELACYLNLTNRTGLNPTDATTVDEWVAGNNRGQGTPSGPRQ